MNMLVDVLFVPRFWNAAPETTASISRRTLCSTPCGHELCLCAVQATCFPVVERRFESWVAVKMLLSVNVGLCLQCYSGMRLNEMLCKGTRWCFQSGSPSGRSTGCVWTTAAIKTSLTRESSNWFFKVILVLKIIGLYKRPTTLFEFSEVVTRRTLCFQKSGPCCKRKVGRYRAEWRSLIAGYAGSLQWAFKIL